MVQTLAASGILSNKSVQEEINARAVDAWDKGRLCGVAKDSVSEAIRKANETGENPLDDELADVAIRAVHAAGPCPPQCGRCEYHKSKANTTPGKTIPGQSGKCTNPTGLCAHMRAIADKLTGDAQEGGEALVPEISEQRGAEITQMQNSAAIAAQAVMDVEGVLRDLGRLDAALFFATVADSTLVQIFEKIKKEKAYKKIPIRDKDGNVRLSQDLKEFCEAKLGKSYRRLQELSQHMQVLGSDLYESAERIGFRSKDYRALKALPAEEQAVVKQALESESKDEVLAILEDLAAKHQAEREAAKKEKADLAADLEARGKLLEDKAKRLERTEEELYKLKSLPPDEQIVLKLAREEEAIKELNAAQMASLASLNQFLVQIETILETPGISVQTSQYAIGLVQSWCESINTELTNYGIPVDFENIVSPEWMRDAARTDLESGQTTEPGAMGRGW